MGPSVELLGSQRVRPRQRWLQLGRTPWKLPSLLQGRWLEHVATCARRVWDFTWRSVSITKHFDTDCRDASRCAICSPADRPLLRLRFVLHLRIIGETLQLRIFGFPFLSSPGCCFIEHSYGEPNVAGVPFLETAGPIPKYLWCVCQFPGVYISLCCPGFIVLWWIQFAHPGAVRPGLQGVTLGHGRHHRPAAISGLPVPWCTMETHEIWRVRSGISIDSPTFDGNSPVFYDQSEVVYWCKDPTTMCCHMIWHIYLLTFWQLLWLPHLLDWHTYSETMTYSSRIISPSLLGHTLTWVLKYFMSCTLVCFLLTCVLTMSGL